MIQGEYKMKIIVKLNLGLEKYSRDNKRIEEIIIEGPINVQGLMDDYDFYPGEIGVILVNGRIESTDTMLQDKDYVEFYPIFGGG